MLARIKKDDMVMVTSGRDKGKTGSVIEVKPKTKKALVKGVALVTKHAKPRRQGETGGIKKKESYVRLSILLPICGGCGKPCRVNTDMGAGDKPVRTCNKCKKAF